MRKGIDMYLEIVFLILMLAISASFTFMAVKSLSGQTSRIADDKVLVEQGQRVTDEQREADGTITDKMLYDVGSLLLSIQRFDYGYPFRKIKVSYGETIEIDVKDVETLSNPSIAMKKIVELSHIAPFKEDETKTKEENDAAKAEHDKKMQEFYAKKLKFEMKNEDTQLVLYIEIQDK